MDIPKVTAFFESLGIVAPAFDAVLAGCSECFGGLLLLLGLGLRFITIPLLTTMTVAYLTADLDKVKHIFAEPDKFVTADTFFILVGRADRISLRSRTTLLGRNPLTDSLRPAR